MLVFRPGFKCPAQVLDFRLHAGVFCQLLKRMTLRGVLDAGLLRMCLNVIGQIESRKYTADVDII